jgi:predicted dehydrogenase
MQKIYRVAVIGHTNRGNYGHGIDTVWLSVPGTLIVAVADADKEGLAEAAKRLKTDRVYNDYRQMLDETKPDIVAICPRWLDQHRDMVVAAADRGIHVYMEKPMCRSLVEADEMVAACERSQVRLAIAHQTRYSPKIQAVKDLIAAGKLGRILEYRGRGKEDRRGGGEDLWVLGSHIMDLIRNFGDEPQWCMASVLQDGRPIRRSDVVEGNEGIGPLAGDAVRAMYGMPDGSTAYFSSYRNATGNPSRFGLQIFGSQGIVEILTGHLPAVKYLPDASWSPGRSGKQWLDVSSAGIGEPEPYQDGGLGGGNVLAVKDLIDAIEEDRQPEASVYEARGTVEMIAAIFESQRTGCPAAMPLKNRQNPLTMLSAS